MPRAIWTGSISFGLVNVPVKVYSAISEQDLHFNQFQEGTNDRIRYKRVNERTGREVDYEDIVKGYELSKGHYVMLTSDELEEYKPNTTRTIDIEDFVELDEIDPIYFERTYYLAPDGEAAGKAYALMRKALEDKGKAGVGKVVMRTKQYLAAVRPLEGVLALSTMRFADEVVDRKDLDTLPSKAPSVSKREVDMAGQIIDSLSVDWDPKRYEDTYRQEVLGLIKQKAKGEEIVVEESAPEEAKVVDLMAALEASLEQARGRRSSGSSRSRSSSRSSSKSKGRTSKSTSKRSSSKKKSGTRKKAAAKKSA